MNKYKIAIAVLVLIIVVLLLQYNTKVVSYEKRVEDAIGRDLHSARTSINEFEDTILHKLRNELC